MTYRRRSGTFAAAFTEAVRALGAPLAAAVTGISGARLRQLANPCRPDANTLAHAVALDVAAARAGHGTPVFDAYRAQLLAAGVRPGWEAQVEKCRAVLAEAAGYLRGTPLEVTP